MKTKIYAILLLILVAISCNDDESLDLQEKNSSSKRASLKNVTRIAIDGTFYSMPKGSSIENEIAKYGKDIKRVFFTPAESSTLFMFTSDELFGAFIGDNYPQFDMNLIQQQASDGKPESASPPENGRIQNLCGEWDDFDIVLYFSDGRNGTVSTCSASGLGNFRDVWGQVPPEMEFKAPSSGTISASIHAYEDGKDCPFFGPCFLPVVVFVPEGYSVVVENKVSNGWDHRRGESFRYSFNRIPSEDLYLVSNGTMYIVDRSLGSGIPYISGLSENHIASAGDFIALIDNGTLYRLNPYNTRQKSLGGGWQGTEAFTAGKIGSTPFAFAVHGGQLWKTNLVTGATVSMGSGWQGAEAMTFGNGNLFIVWNDQLWRVNASNTSTTVIESANWTGTEAMTFHKGFIYAVHQGSFYQTSPNGGSTYLGNAWDGTVSLTSYGDYMYGLQGGYIWETYTNGSTSNGRGMWPNGVGMTAIYQ